jgi:hypothetical protein
MRKGTPEFCSLTLVISHKMVQTKLNDVAFTGHYHNDNE